MNTFLLSFDANTSFSGGNPPTLEILVGGVVVSSVTMVSGATSYDVFIEYTGTAPSSLSFRFDGASGDPGDTITFTAVSINSSALNLGTDLTATILAQAQSSVVSAGTDLFGHTTPSIGVPNVTGTAGDDANLSGGNAADTIDGLAGADRIRGLGGDDTINGGDGDDMIFGEGGADTVIAGNGNDMVFGNDGDDILYGEADNDYLIGGAGNDILNGGAGNDGLLGDAGDDILFGEDGDDWLIGDDGDDILFGDDGNDTLIGGADNDALAGGDGDDYISGGTGNDLLSGGDGADEIIAGTGDDIASGGAGNDSIYGDDGADELAGGDDDDYISGGDGDDTLDGDAGVDVLVGGAGADTMNGGTGDDILHAHGLDAVAISDILFNNPNVVYSQETGSFYQFVSANVDYAAAVAAASATTLNGVAGHLATITSAAENTYVSGLLSDDSYISGADIAQNGTWQWNAGLEAGVQFSDVSGTSVNGMYENWASGQPQVNTEYNAILYTTGVWHDWVDTSTHSYVIEWEAGLMSDDGAADILSGGAGNDWIYGYDGDDTLNGDGDDDVIFGGDGSDIIDGGSGNDVLFAYDATVQTSGTAGGGSTVTALEATFDTDEDGFTYADGFPGVGGSDGANVTISGNYISGDGNTSAGSIEVNINSTGNPTGPLSGSYSQTITTTADLTSVQMSISYSMFLDGTTETGENLYLYVTVDGTQYGLGGNNWVDELNGVNGDGADHTTGWLTETLNIADLSAGSHTIRIGAYLNDTSQSSEDGWIRFDDILLTGVDTTVGSGSTGVEDAGETNVVSGGDGADTIYGSTGMDTLNGDAGADTIYSASANEAWDALVAQVLADNAGVVYSVETNSFYQHITTNATWTTANTNANAATLTGLTGNGYLATITSQAEQDYVWSLGGGNNLWGGATDVTTEGNWVWQGGSESGLTFWTGGAANSGGAAINGHYDNWRSDGSEPWGGSSTADYFILNSALGGQWWTENNNAVYTGNAGADYVIEWDADELLTSVDYTTINGGAGADTLYGNDGIDIFLFETATWDATDTIENFSATGRDAIDISDLLSGYSYTTSNINDFVTLTEASGNTTIAVDANGATGGASFTNVAVLNGVTGLDLYQMIAADNLIV
ncbi:MAG TPA: type I secretion C-terminal target domain-containing protein [Alphaproteobacteria bacterium]|nr:type I secretion C-terminal target domain-containing protein [Alphaproteobacteria bacterium]USO05782.1 MAG: type I secretion C-terminal target domain-containing protein [Rhodospirillales bacterium]HOO81799.1 type I secretion C-terminal target domain-containing protein [Alphaproteobacteria bacterium]